MKHSLGIIKLLQDRVEAAGAEKTISSVCYYKSREQGFERYNNKVKQ